MWKKNMAYRGVIVLSVLAIMVPVILVLRILSNDIDMVMRIASGACTFLDILQVVTIVACIIVYKPLAELRQRLRDDVDYDEHGISRKHGNFSKLSNEERRRIEEQKMIDAERILDSATMKRITHKGETDPEAAMAKLIGLEEVKRSMHEMAARMAYDMGDKKGRKKKHNKPTNSMHMIFMGPPGTGKTTAARIMAGFLYKNGYIRKNQCVEVDGNFLNGMSPGESSKKTEMLITKSLGGVLFIDEAYALLQKNGSGYGQEAIATIVKAMEDQKDDIVFILAGYDKEMRELINSNPGIESRIKKYLWFGDYSVNNLQDIFRAMAGEHNFCVSAEMMEAFGERMRQEMNQPNFGNARTARNFLDQAIDMHATNLMDGKLDASKRYSLEGVDMPIPDKHAHV